MGCRRLSYTATGPQSPVPSIYALRYYTQYQVYIYMKWCLALAVPRVPSAKAGKATMAKRPAVVRVVRQALTSPGSGSSCVRTGHVGLRLRGKEGAALVSTRDNGQLHATRLAHPHAIHTPPSPRYKHDTPPRRSYPTAALGRLSVFFRYTSSSQKAGNDPFIGALCMPDAKSSSSFSLPIDTTTYHLDYHHNPNH
jgi:hypothetical protein